eukprot:2604629-Amphidinium_carterae.1
MCLLQDIDEATAWTYDMLSNGVYRAGFATQQGTSQACRVCWAHRRAAAFGHTVSVPVFFFGLLVTQSG